MMKISIIVSTRNRAYAIESCLGSIAAALSVVKREVDAELLVVDNGSTDDTAARVSAWAGNQDFPVRLIFEPRKGLSVARNRGLREANGAVIAFTDDDCRLSRRYFRDLLRHFEADEEPVLRGGRVELGDPLDLPLSIKTVDTKLVWKKSEAAARRQNLGDTIIGCNMAVSREVIRRIGPFDERLGAGASIPGGEDTDYVLRAYRAGFPICYVPDMTVIHCHGRKVALQGQALLKNYALGWGALYLKYMFVFPELCLPFYWDIKNAGKEILLRRNTFLPLVNFSHREKVFYSVIGAARFVFSFLRKSRI